MTDRQSETQNSRPEQIADNPQAEVEKLPAQSNEDEYREALAEIWLAADEYSGDGFSISRKCEYASGETGRGLCELILRDRQNPQIRYVVEESNKEQLKYGFIDMLGKGSKQLVIFNYSGGAHCCYDYSIYELKPKLRNVYDSRQYDSANKIGNELVPVDIDGDGLFEFRRDVMAFDYMAAEGHAGSTFPPAIFRYDKAAAKYLLATKRFPDFVMADLEQLLRKVESRRQDRDRNIDEYLVRTRFLYMIYAGKRTEAWQYFEENYRSKTGDGYQEQFKDKFRQEFKELFAKDPTYRSIYQ